MNYLDIFILGWNLNALMFVVNFFMAIMTIKRSDIEAMQEQSIVLEELKSEFDKYYPNRKMEVIISYLVPFTAFFRISLRILELLMFFTRNKGTTMFDFMVYKYSKDIEKAKFNK